MSSECSYFSSLFPLLLFQTAIHDFGACIHPFCEMCACGWNNVNALSVDVFICVHILRRF